MGSLPVAGIELRKYRRKVAIQQALDECQTVVQPSEPVQLAERAGEQHGDTQIFAASEEDGSLAHHRCMVGGFGRANRAAHLLLRALADGAPFERQELRVILEIYATRRGVRNRLEQFFKIDRRHHHQTVETPG